MPIWSLTRLWTRWRANRRHQTLAVAQAADTAEQAAARQRILDATMHRQDIERPDRAGPTRAANIGPFRPVGQQRGYQRRSGDAP
jgi:hypothetical protein